MLCKPSVLSLTPNPPLIVTRHMGRPPPILQAKRLLSQVRADSALPERSAGDDGGAGESLDTAGVPEEVEALYRGTVY